MVIYSYGQARQRLEYILERALSEGGVRLRGRDGRLFVIKPEVPTGRSPLDVPPVRMNISRETILAAISESRSRG